MYIEFEKFNVYIYIYTYTLTTYDKDQGKCLGHFEMDFWSFTYKTQIFLFEEETK